MDRLGTVTTPTPTEPVETPRTTHAQRCGVFATTHWSVVRTAGDLSAAGANAALESLCSRYWQPLYAYVRRMGRNPADAQDLTQAFFARLLAGNMFAQADPARGRFRTLLLTSLKHFLANEWEKARSLKRGGGMIPIPLDFDTAETRYGQPPSREESPDRAFDRQWALSILDVVLTRLRREYADCGREALFLGLRETLTGARAETPYRSLAVQLGLSEGAVKIAAHRLRHRYRELLREEVARTLADPSEVEVELRHLFAALVSP